MWNDKFLHQYKRNLSRFEKLMVREVGCINWENAMIFPGAANTEAEELENILIFHEHQIFCIEQRPEVADELYDHYYDRYRIHLDTATDFLKKTCHKFGYIHLDYCCLFGEMVTEDLFRAAKTTPTKTPQHLRVSVSNSRKTDKFVIYEKVTAQYLAQIFDRPEFVNDLSTHQILSLCMLLAVNLPYKLSIVDITFEDLAEVKNPRRISNRYNISYREEGNGIEMLTSFFTHESYSNIWQQPEDHWETEVNEALLTTDYKSLFA